MKLAIMQPYFFPYIGYFQLIDAVDHFLIFDDVQYIERGWIHRNRILLNNEPAYINLPIKKAPRDTLINQRELAAHEMPRYKDKIIGQLQATYKKSPHYQAVVSLVETVLSYPETNVALFLQQAIKVVCDYLSITTTIGLSSSVKIENPEVRGQDRIIALCKAMQADHYINSIGGQSLYTTSEFAQQGIELHFIKMSEITYQQPAPDFVPHLSIIDVMMCNEPTHIKKMLGQYELIKSH